MTPEEYEAEREMFRGRILDAVNEIIVHAVAAEREACAQIAEDFASAEPWYDTHSSETGEADAIAAAIREREKGVSE